MRAIIACVLLFAANATAQNMRIPEQYVDYNGRLLPIGSQHCQCFNPRYSYPIYVSPYPPPYVPARYRFSVPVGQQYITDPPTFSYPDGRLEWRFDMYGNVIPPWGMR